MSTENSIILLKVEKTGIILHWRIENSIYMVQEGVQISAVHTPGLWATSDAQTQDLHNLL